MQKPETPKMKNRHIGSSLDSFLKDEGIYEETQAQAIEEVIKAQSNTHKSSHDIRQRLIRLRQKSPSLSLP
jgi:antitoxin HicB